MFVGALPKETLEQVTRLVRLDNVAEAYVCCSGSFRLEQTLAQLSDRVDVIGNDVSLVTSAVGTYAATEDCFPFRFHGELEPFEERLEGATVRQRIAAILVAGQMSRFTGKSEHAALHRQHYLHAFDAYLKKADEKLTKLLLSFRMRRFECRDFRDHAREGIARRALILGFPPTYRGGYESLYRFLSRNIEWPEPSYDVFDPEDIGDWVLELHESGAPYLVGCDKALESLRPAASFANTGKHTLYIYARTDESSLLRRGHTMKPFRYDAVDAAALAMDTRVTLVQVGAGEMNFLKEQYLARNIDHTPGHLNFLVYLGGKLAGGFIYTRSKHDPTKTLYLLSDFSVVRERRVSKLVAMLAASEQPVGVAARRMLIRPEHVFTTAFTDRPVSMKYRGIYELVGRGERFLNYASAIRRQDPADVYAEWWRKYAARDANHARPAA